ncbi:MAG: hypothetical protein LBS23_01695 [Holosporaceae bacterium]|nr:hypothetical protein [Holosporaceae bacterium]
MKNKKLKKIGSKKLCKTHNDKKTDDHKIKLSTYKSYNLAKFYHPLKNKEIKTHKLKFVRNIYDFKKLCNAKKTFYKYNSIATKIYCSDVAEAEQDQQAIWTNEIEVVDWLTSIGVAVKRIAAKRYILKNRICFINHVLVFANRKRIELGLKPFYIEGITEF